MTAFAAAPLLWLGDARVISRAGLFLICTPNWPLKASLDGAMMPPPGAG